MKSTRPLPLPVERLRQSQPNDVEGHKRPSARRVDAVIVYHSKDALAILVRS
jgi:hypothetical protein